MKIKYAFDVFIKMKILTFIEDINISNQFYFYGNDMIVCQYISTTESLEKKQCHT